MIIDTSKYTGSCPCGRRHELRTKLIVCEYGALDRFEKYAEACGLRGFCTAVYDTNTYALEGLTHIPAGQEIVLDSDGLYSEKGKIEDMMSRLVRKPDYIAAIGGGTIMDFGRYSAHKLGIPFVSVPTALSSDGFTADVCSIMIDGHKRSIPMQAADAVICDLRVASKAPMALTVAGIEDILAKYISIADWKIAHLVSGEYFCDRICSMAQEALDTMARCAGSIACGGEPDFEAIAYAHMLSGLTIQIMSGSRAASGAEHLIAHLVEMKPAGFEHAHGMHGECVGLGTLLCAREYRKAVLPDKPELRPYPPLDRTWVENTFRGNAGAILRENEDDVLLRVRPSAIAENWQEIKRIVSCIPEYGSLLELYKKLGAKHSLEELGIDGSVEGDLLLISSAIRNRLTFGRIMRLLK